VTKAEVQERMLRVLQAMKEEEELKAQLLQLDFGVSRAGEVDRAYRRQKELLGAIELIRSERVLPVLSELAAFVAEAKAKSA